MPTLQGPDVKIDKVIVTKAEKGVPGAEITFENIGDKWYQKDGKQQVRVEGFRVDQLISQIKSTRSPKESIRRLRYNSIAL